MHIAPHILSLHHYSICLSLNVRGADICNRLNLISSHPDADKLFVQHHPGEQVDEADAGREERDAVGAGELAESLRVQVVCDHPQKTEQERPQHKLT